VINLMLKRLSKVCEKVIIVIMILSLALLGPIACEKAPAGNKSSNDLINLQKNKYITARLYGVMNFDFSGRTVSWPTELKIASVPLEWMGQVFNGRLVVVGTQYNLVDQVHGSVSADGRWLLTLTYSRQVVRTPEKVTYSVSLRNVPIFISANTTGKTRNFEIEGDVQKYVESIGYSAGETGPTPAKYLSMDWANSGQGLQPILKVTFEQEPSDNIGPPGLAPPGM
jgi:hypothetical protein